MFGYVTVDKDTLCKQDFEVFQAYYCGLCKAMGKHCTHISRLGLSYDMVFLGVVLSSVCDDDVPTSNERCIVHPFSKRMCIEKSRSLDYCADVSVMLGYLKLLDDWKDERSLKALAGMLLFKRGVRKARRRYGDLYGDIKKYLDKLSLLEKENCNKIDETADCFAKISELMFTPDFIADKSLRRILAWLGYNVGRWIYIIDAYNDLEADIKGNNYNTFKAGTDKTADEIKSSIGASLCTSLTFTLENIASAYELLDIRRNKGILDNIIYTALKAKQNNITGEYNESV